MHRHPRINIIYFCIAIPDCRQFPGEQHDLWTRRRSPLRLTAHMASKGHLCSRTCIEYSARIPFVVRPNERNVLDQRQLEYELVENTESTLSVKPLSIDRVRVGIYRADRSYHVAPISVNSTVAELTPSLIQKLLPHQEGETHKLYVKGRVLAPTERPAAIVIRRLQQAGDDQADSLAFLGAEDMTFLMKFVYKSQTLGPTSCVTLRDLRPSYHVAPISVNSTVAELTPPLNQKLLPHQERETHKPSLKESGRERVLAPTKRPAAIVMRRLQQAGYDQADSLAFLCAEDMTFLVKLVYKSQLLGPTFAIIDLTGCSLPTIPVVLHQNASSIVYLNLSRNPMVEIPLDFIQSCVTLRDLRLS
ncbi:hypothetical protein M405DRAFT_880175, partial [Rhizopogon salebrosus TDB-379]